MSETYTIDVPDDAAREIEEAARAAGQTPEAFVAEAAALRARALAQAQAFFADRGRGADLDAARRILAREGGLAPDAEDTLD